MGKTCILTSCRSKKKLFKIPSKAGCNTILTVERRKLWLSRLKISESEVSKNSYVCGQHFITGKPAHLKDQYDPDWAPCKNLPDLPQCIPEDLTRTQRRLLYNIRRTDSLNQKHKTSQALTNDKEQGKELAQKSSRAVTPVKEAAQCRMLIEVEKQLTTHAQISLKAGASSVLEVSQEKQICIKDTNPKKEQEEPLEYQDASHDHQCQSFFNVTPLGTKHSEEEWSEHNHDAACNQRETPQRKVESLFVKELSRRDEHIKELERQVNELKSDMFETIERTEKSFYERCRSSNHDMRFYTNFDVNTFDSLHHLVKAAVKENKNTALTTAEQLFLCLVKLVRDFSIEDLAFRFRVSASTVTRYFYRWVSIIYLRLHCTFIVWPTKEAVSISMPMCFRSNFSDTVAIIDFFEIKAQVIHTPLDQASMYSRYKAAHTAKYLIAITPQGSVSFISKGYTGKTSDAYIVKSSGILDLIKPGDVVLADRGFTAPEAFGLRGATLVTPAFMQRRAQLSQRETESNRKVSNVRIHVERVIGSLRMRFKILCGPLNVTFFSVIEGESESFIDRIVAVCCILHNLFPSVVPAD